MEKNLHFKVKNIKVSSLKIKNRSSRKLDYKEYVFLGGGGVRLKLDFLIKKSCIKQWKCQTKNIGIGFISYQIIYEPIEGKELRT